jgi:hypothetical protein
MLGRAAGALTDRAEHESVLGLVLDTGSEGLSDRVCNQQQDRHPADAWFYVLQLVSALPPRRGRLWRR